MFHVRLRLNGILCVLQALPQFPPAAGNSRPISFRKVLLNTCQEEFEGATAAREVSLLY